MADLYGVLTTLPGDQRAVRYERDYADDVDELWSALTEPDRLARWLDPVSGDLSVGGAVTVHFDDGDAAFEIVACEGPHRLVVRWVHDADRSSEVAVTVTELAGGSRLVLEHSLLPATSAAAYAAGWHWHLDALDAVLRGEQPGAWSSFDALYADYQRATSVGR